MPEDQWVFIGNVSEHETAASVRMKINISPDIAMVLGEPQQNELGCLGVYVPEEDADYFDAPPDNEDRHLASKIILVSLLAWIFFIVFLFSKG